MQQQESNIQEENEQQESNIQQVANKLA